MRVSVLLNDIERTDDGGYILPTLLSGSPLEIVVRIEVTESAATANELFSVRLYYSHQSNEMSVDASLALQTASKDTVESLPSDPDVLRSLQMLQNARARREAMERIDRGDREGALDEIAMCSFKMAAAPESVRDTPEFEAEANDLEILFSLVGDGEDDAMARKQMAYGREKLRKGR